MSVDPLRQAPPTEEIRREPSVSTFPSAADGGTFAALIGGDSGFPGGSVGGDSGFLGSPAAGDIGAMFPGANMDYAHPDPGAGADQLGGGYPRGPDGGFLNPTLGGDFGALRIPFGPDSAVPSYITLNPDGTVGADFSGHVEAQGLDLITATGVSSPGDRQVRWIRESDGTVSARVVSLDTSASKQLAQWQAEVAAKRAALEITVNNTDDTDTWVDAVIAGTAPEVRRRVLDALGRSGYIQSTKGNFSRVFLNYGVTNLVWSAAVTSASKVVAHGLTRQDGVGIGPDVVFLCPISGGGAVFEAMYRVTSVSATNFTCDGTRTGGTTGNSNVAWLALATG